VTTRTAKAGLLTRRMIIAMVAMGIIALALGYFTHPVYATSGATLQESQIGTDSSQATDDCAGAGVSVPAGEVLWHFILNGLEPGITSAISGQFDFENDGILNVDSSKWNPDGTTHHFYVFTSGDDVLNGATADIGESTYNNFVLSHICHGDEEQQSVSESVSESIAESVPESIAESVPASAEESVAGSEAQSASGEQSVEAGTGTPAESVSNGAFSLNGVGALPTILFSLVLLASLGALAYANVKSVRS
jgi:hypothetical protein